MALANLPEAHHWTLDEAANATREDTIGSFDLDERDAALSAVEGKVGDACDFPGTADDVLQDTIAAADLAIGDKYFAICAWVRLDQIASGQYVASKYQNSGTLRNWVLGFGLPDAVPTWQFFVYPDAGSTSLTIVRVQPTITAGKWHLLLAWHDPVSDEIGIYSQADDAESFEKNTTELVGGVDTVGSTLLSLGSPGEANFSVLNGQLDNVTIWHDTAGAAADAAPTDADFEMLFNEGLGTEHPYTYPNGNGNGDSDPSPRLLLPPFYMG